MQNQCRCKKQNFISNISGHLMAIVSNGNQEVYRISILRWAKSVNILTFFVDAAELPFASSPTFEPRLLIPGASSLKKTHILSEV
jgi:hypothetical protein